MSESANSKILRLQSSPPVFALLETACGCKKVMRLPRLEREIEIPVAKSLPATWEPEGPPEVPPDVTLKWRVFQYSHWEGSNLAVYKEVVE